MLFRGRKFEAGRSEATYLQAALGRERSRAMCSCGYKVGDKVKYREIAGEITAKKDIGDSCEIELKFVRNDIESEITVSCAQISRA